MPEKHVNTDKAKCNPGTHALALQRGAFIDDGQPNRTHQVSRLSSVHNRNNTAQPRRLSGERLIRPTSGGRIRGL